VPINCTSRRQHGVVLLLAVIVLFATAVLIFTTLLMDAVRSRLERAGGSVARLHHSETALLQFVAREGRLPCPADGSLLPGDANRGLEAACTAGPPSATYQATGILPWRTLAMREDEAINAYGDFYSYRVFSGPTGFTRTNGVDMTHCDTDNTPNPTDPTAAAVDCESATHDNTADQFILNKGLTVVLPDNSSVTGVAYVVIDHGPNRRGARNPVGSVTVPTLASRPEEVANAAGISASDYSGSYYARALSIGNEETAATYFDDALHYRRIADVAQLASRYARNWPDNYFDAAMTSNLTVASTSPAAPHFIGTQNPVIADRGFAVSLDGNDATVSFGEATGSYAGCLWSPIPIPLFDGTKSRTFRLSLEFALRDQFNDVAPGFTAGFLSATAASGPPTNDLCGNTQLSRSGSGSWGSNTLYLNSTVGVVPGQRIRGDGITDTTLITAVSQTQLGVSANNTGAVSGIVMFSPTPVTVAGSGVSGSDYISVSNLTGIRINSLVTGTGVAAGARVMTASGTTIRLTRPNTGSVSGNLTFSGPTVSVAGAGSIGANTISVNSVYGLENGMLVIGAGIAPGAVITSIQSGAVTLNRALDWWWWPPRAVTIRPATLGDIQRDLGWAGGVLGTAYPDRFAVEVDNVRNADASDPDPDRTHMAMDYSGVTHNDTAAASCASAASGAACDKHPTSDNYLVNGSTAFHNLRIELAADQYCLSGTGTGSTGSNSVTVASTTGLAVGMNAIGPGLGPNAKIASINGLTSTLTLTEPHVEAFSNKPLTFFGSSLSQTSSGALGSTTLTVADASVLAVGMRVSGTGIATGSEIVSVDSGTTVTVSIAHTAAVSGSVTFGGRRVVAKAWTLSAAGCTADPVTCRAMKNVDSDFAASLATNTEALQIAKCIPVPTLQTAYESLYFGLTTANRGISGAVGANSYFRNLLTN
jgi:hypothetical protein